MEKVLVTSKLGLTTIVIHGIVMGINTHGGHWVPIGAAMECVPASNHNSSYEHNGGKCLDNIHLHTYPPISHPLTYIAHLSSIAHPRH